MCDLNALREPSATGSDRDWEISDEECLRKFQAGEKSAFAVLFERYRRLVVGIARRILRDVQESEDLLQSVFLEIFQNAERFDPSKGTVRTWILQYSYHRSYNRKKYLSIRGFYRDRTTGPADQSWHDRNAQPGGLSHEEAERLLSRALHSLPALHRRILEKVFFEGKTIKEVAAEESVSVGNVRHYYYRSLEKLRRQLGRTEGPER